MTHNQQRPATRSGTTSRRAALAAAGAFALALSPFPPRATTAGTDQAPSHQPEPRAHSTYVLAGEGIDIRYETSPHDGTHRLAIAGDIGDMTFDGEQIAIEGSAHLGNLVTVQIDVVYDAWTLELTFLLPRINGRPGSEGTSFTSVAILTKHFSNIGGPSMVKGPLQSYEARALTGTLLVTAA